MKRIINKIKLFFSSLNVIGNVNELIVKMHKIQDNNIYLDNRLRELSIRIDNNYDTLEDKIEEEGKIIDEIDKYYKYQVEVINKNINLSDKGGK